MFCTLRTKLAPNARERRKSSKIEAFRPPKTSPGTSGTARNRARAAMFERKNAKIEREALRFFLSLRARASRSEKSAPETAKTREMPECSGVRYVIIDKDVCTRWRLLCRTVKALLESGGFVVKVVRASSSSPTMDGRKTWALTFCVLLFERAKRPAQPMQHRAPHRTRSSTTTDTSGGLRGCMDVLTD